MKFVIDLWMDACESEEELQAACREFIVEQLDFAGSSVKILEDEQNLDTELIAWCKQHAQGIFNLDENLPDGVGSMEIGKAHGYLNVVDELEKRRHERGY